MSLISELEKIGLSEKEARVYLAALELGHTPVQAISKKARVNRATTYVILDTLIKKGLCSTYQEGKKTRYIAESPQTLGTLFAIKKKEIEEKQKHLEQVLPQLKSIYNVQEGKPVVRFFEGKEGLVTMINELLTEGRTRLVRMVYSVDDINKVFTGEERRQARQRRIGKSMKTKVLYTLQEGELQSTPDGERIKIPQEEFPITCDVALFDGKVRIASLGKRLSGVIVQDPEIYRTLVSIFELAWEAAKARQQSAAAQKPK